MSSETPIVPDTKDWTWVLDRPCPECGFAATTVARAELGEQVRDNARAWAAVLAGPDVASRPEPAVWSPLEYACHVRDVHRVFAGRVARMLAEDAPTYDNWDQDATALEQAYDRQSVGVVGPELAEAANRIAQAYDEVPPGAWLRTGRRSNGSEFTVESLGRYHLHDVVHHLHDVRQAAGRATVAAHDGSA